MGLDYNLGLIPLTRAFHYLVLTTQRSFYFLLLIKRLCIFTVSVTELQQGSVAVEQGGILRDAFMRCNDPTRWGLYPSQFCSFQSTISTQLRQGQMVSESYSGQKHGFHSRQYLHSWGGVVTSDLSLNCYVSNIIELQGF